MRRKVVCHLRKGGDLKKEMIIMRVLSGVVYMARSRGRELSLVGRYRAEASV